MLETISVDAEYCFGKDPVRLDRLGKVNFIFASNGAGKTTISNALATQPIDEIERSNWAVAPTDLPIRVFNEAYRARVLTERVNGIFTIGEDSKSINDAIAQLEAKKRTRIDDREGWRKQIGSNNGSDTPYGLLGEIQREWDTAQGTIFPLHKQIPPSLVEVVFKGFRSKRDNFLEEAIRRFTNHDAPSTELTWEELEKRVKSLQSDTQARVQLPDITATSLISDSDIADVGSTISSGGSGEFATLIQHLQNEDWVSEGRQYIHDSVQKCPFCQQRAPNNLEQKLQEYFAGGFDDALQQAKSIQRTAWEQRQKLELELSGLEAALDNDPHVDESLYKPLFARVHGDTEILLTRLNERSEHPTRPVEAIDITESVGKLIRFVEVENHEIDNHNELVANSGTERKRLVDDGWDLFLSGPAVSSALRRHQGTNSQKQASIADLRSKLTSSEKEDEDDDRQLDEFRKGLSNTTDVADRINRLLRAMGFHRFSLEVADTASGGYRIVREDGTPAFDSLSEGEKSFISFAYFWESLFGSEVSGGDPEDVIAVFDDPISSLDSDSLFMVAAHIRDAAQQAIKGKSNLRQLVVLTHNTQFHQEASYSPGRTSNDRRYYRLVKNLNGLTSSHNDGTESKIRGSYSVLWYSIVEAARTNDESDLIQVGIFNTVRRILEGYFKIIGNVSDYQRSAHLPATEQRMMSQFHIWANSGSHTIADDSDQAIDVGSTKQFLKLFQQYFKSEGHGPHFDMMIRASQGADLLAPDEVFGGG